jgi:prepilin-type N-terminal cleavage/methylation domain-containing protein
MTLNQARSGLTLLELMMVMAILAITAVGVIPIMSIGGQVQVYSAADRLAVDLSYARNLAITRGQFFGIRFDLSQETYQIEDANGQVITHPVTKNAYQVAFAGDSRFSRVDIVQANFDGTIIVRFDYQGCPYNGSGNPLNSGMVTLTADSETRIVTIEPVTGVISVQP